MCETERGKSAGFSHLPVLAALRESAWLALCLFLFVSPDHTKISKSGNPPYLSRLGYLS